MDEISNCIPTSCLIPFPTDPGFTERAARYSSFGSFNSKEAKVGILQQTGKLSRVSSSQSLKSKENSSVTDLGGENSGRKRKGVLKAKAKVAGDGDLDVKKCRAAENCDEIDEEKQGKEPPKGYIHVRARRGQATDSHSLAERIRREKISQRMKVLQDLVPGCNKITGKALMLDEIINYVQSLQWQVEFLSMKLAHLVSKEHFMSQTNAFLPSSVHHLDTLGATFPCTDPNTHSFFSQVNNTLYQTPYMHSTSFDVYGATVSQLVNPWDDDLHSIVQMSLVENQEIEFTSNNFHGRLPANKMKAEL